MQSTKSNRPFNDKIAPKNPQAYYKQKGLKALEKAKELHNLQVKNGLIAVRDSKTKSIRFVKMNSENLNN